MNDADPLIDRLLAEADPRQGVARVAGIVLDGLRRHLAADCALLLAHLPGEAARLFRATAAEVGEAPWAQVAPFASACAALPAGLHAVAPPAVAPPAVAPHAPAPHAPDLPAQRRPSAPGEAEAAAPAHEIARLCGVRALLCVPAGRRAVLSGWLLVGAADPAFARHPPAPVARVMEQLAPLIANASLLEQLAEEAAATERARIGRDLHDSAIQPYLGLKYGVEALARKVDADNPLRHDILALHEMVASELEHLREAVARMRSGTLPGDDSLAPALRRQARRFAALFGIAVSVDCARDIPLSRRLAAELFHLVSEALTNIRRHTRATRAAIHVAPVGGHIVLRIRNDHGDAPAPAPFTPRSLSERSAALGGQLTLAIRPGQTEMVITLPLHAA